MTADRVAPAADTTPGVDRRYRALLLGRPGEDRVRMGESLHATARALAVASVLARDPAASAATLRQAVFLRFYGHECAPEIRARILARLGGEADPAASR